MTKRGTGYTVAIAAVLLVEITGVAHAQTPAEAEQLSSPTASLTVGVAAEPLGDDDNTVFEFGGTTGGFQLGDGGSVTFAGLEAGSYTVTGTLPTGWQFDGVSCLGVEPQVSAGEAAMTVTLEQGQPAACTFYLHQEETAGPNLPSTGPQAFLIPLLIAGLWGVLTGAALWIWSLMKEAGGA